MTIADIENYVTAKKIEAKEIIDTYRHRVVWVGTLNSTQEYEGKK